MTNHNEVQNVPSDAEIAAIYERTQTYPLSDEDWHGAILFARVILAEYSAPLGPLTLSLSPDPRGVHVAVHQGSECVHAEAMALPGAVGQGDRVIEKIDTIMASLNGAHTAHSQEWKDACFWSADRAYAEIKAVLAASPTPPAGEGQEPVHQVFHSNGTWEDVDNDALINCQENGKETRTLYAHPAPQAAQGEREAIEKILIFIFARFGRPGDALELPDSVVSAVRLLEARAALSTPPTGADDDDSTNLQIECAMLLALHQTGAGTYYMDPPDGGNVLASEQVIRMGLDAKRYRAWRDAAVSNNDAFARALKAALPPEAREGKPRWPTADEWDAAVDAAIASMGKGLTCEN